MRGADGVLARGRGGLPAGDFAVAAITASPCGGCRQWLHEMGVDRVVFRNGGRIVTMTPDELLPESFDARPRVRSGFVAVAGRPNVGKSTLVNALCGEKVAITSTVPNTTRRRIFGVAHGADYQLALVDLPGFQRPIDPLTERMQQTVDASFDDVDAVLLVVDARERIGSGDRFVARRVFGARDAGHDRAEQGRPPQARRTSRRR